jgi:hypothetical protein
MPSDTRPLLARIPVRIRPRHNRPAHLDDCRDIPLSLRRAPTLLRVVPDRIEIGPRRRR